VALLIIKEIETFYGQVKVLKRISLEVSEGEIVTLIGTNGAGKTTTLKAISGLVKPRSGEIRFQGQRIDPLPPHDILRIGIAHVPEGRNIFPDMTVLENLKLGGFILKTKETIRQRIERMYAYFPILKERNQQLAGTLSGGEQQMLAIGRGLMSGPRLLLLDEPSLGLSPIMVQKVGRMITEIHGQGMTILLVEQNAKMALQISDRGYVLETGSIIMQEQASHLISNEKVKKAYLGL
jgi:branched-chain amino acid transport system ATP-binding protein